MEKQKFPLKSFQLAQALCSCDGLVLLKNPLADKQYVLWNPSTGNYRALSCPDNHLYYNDEPRNVSAYGLCYESSVGDYKVILIYDLFYAVYSLINGSWTTKTSFPCPVLAVGGNCGSSGISTEGCVFWSLNRRKPFIDKASTIICFDVKSNEVEKLPTPDLVGEKDFFRLTSLKGCLRLYGRIEKKQLDIWIMEQDGNWKWLMNVCNLPTICKTFVEGRKLLCCTGNGEVIFEGWQCLLIYNPRKQLLRAIQKSKIAKLALICLDSLYFSSLNIKCKRKQSTIPLTTRRPKVQKK
ncbi:F-box/kelch-repeat protein At3g23880-like [Lycium barbarum]|uniref:F-box/kelch-repeat protein At3g23880-like n=1 Tax=Lycium barbarum TaxID=112863 RepID=UPI00293F4C3A|nr:F-box/kelch-repeat protein At3g23880-like [Lycium barbarum]